MSTTVDLKQQLNEKGFRITAQRRAILEVFSGCEGKHLSSDEIFRLVQLKHPGIGLATVYRTLPILEKMGLLDRITLDDGFVRYELNNPDEQHFHHHLICLGCGLVQEVQEDMLEGLEKQIQQKNKFLVKNHSLKFFGYCEKCTEGD